MKAFLFFNRKAPNKQLQLSLQLNKSRVWSFILFVFVGLILSVNVFSQTPNLVSNEEADQLYIVEKHDGVKFMGKIITSDAREVLLDTEDLGQIYIPKHTIKTIRPILPQSDHKYVSDELFATRYFITTNGLPITKGENYIQWNWYGPDFQFGVADNFGVGVMTSWAAIPIIATAKYSYQIDEKKSMALGLLAGTGSWSLPKWGLFLPYVAFTYGDRRNNITFSTGYGQIFYEEGEYVNSSGTWEDVNKREGRMLVSIAGMAKLNDKFSIVFDTFIAPWGPYQTRSEYQGWNEITQRDIYVEVTERSPSLAIILPGIRWQMDSDKAFQFGFTGFYFDGGFIQAPIPMIQWYRKL